MIIKILLILALMIILLVYFGKFRTKILDSIIVLSIVLIGIIIIIFPDLTTRVANYLNIGRGTDFILYLFIITFLFTTLIIYSKLKYLERMITKLVRVIAIHYAKQMDENNLLDKNNRKKID